MGRVDSVAGVAAGQGEPDLDALGILREGELFRTKKGKAVSLPRALAPVADTHGHLTDFDGIDPAVALCRAALAGVHFLVVPVDIVDDFGPDKPWKDAAGLLTWLDAQVDRARGLLTACSEMGVVPPALPESFAAAGVPDLLDNVRLIAGAHPYGSTQIDDEALGRLDVLLASPRAVGVGEIGLDVGPYNELPLEVQERAFRQQLRIALERDLPVELHIRDGAKDTDAHDLAARVLAEEGLPRRGCDLHCFTQGPEVMAPFVELGCHVAFGGASTFKRSDDVRDAVAACPQELLLSETDCPYMAPVPLRGQECEPAMVTLTAALLADVRKETLGVSREETYRALWNNACALFAAWGRHLGVGTPLGAPLVASATHGATPPSGRIVLS